LDELCHSIKIHLCAQDATTFRDGLSRWFFDTIAGTQILENPNRERKKK
jgi:hypothetical protein